MKRFKYALAIVVMGLVRAHESTATNITITSFNGNGVLTWTNALPQAVYRIEWAPTLSSAWTNSWEHLVGIQTTSTTCSVTVPMFYRVVGQQPPAYSLPDYYPSDPNIYRKKVFVETDFSNTGLYTNQLTGFNTAPYSSGTIVGTIWTGIGWGYSGSGVFYNDGRTVKFIGNGEFYFSADTGLTAHPSCWSMGQVWDGMIVTQHYYAVKGDRSVCAGPFNQNALIKIQHVTVPMGVYSNSVISWEINPSRPYVTLDFHGTDSELGIVLPTSDDTEGRGVAGFSANGRGTGPIASGTIDVDTGNLIQLKRLQLEVSP